MLNLHRLWSVLFFCLCIVDGPFAVADEQAEPGDDVSAVSPSPFVVDPLVDTLLITTASAIWLITPLFADEVPVAGCDPCDRNDVNGFDRLTVDRHSENSQTASDVLVATLPVAAVGLSLMNLASEGGATEFWIDFALMTEAAAINGMLHRLTVAAFERPRPYMYQDDPSRGPDNVRDFTSFYSGHTSTAFVIATSMSYLFSVRHPKSRWRYVVWIASLTAAGTVGALRVLAGKHFPTDVIGGAVIGGGIGLLVPVLHRRRDEHTPVLAVGPTGMNLSLSF